MLSVLLLVITTWAADVEQEQQDQQGLRSDFSGERNVRTKRRYLQKGKGISKPTKGRKRKAGSRNKIKKVKNYKAKNNHKSRKSETKNEGRGSAKRKNKGKNDRKKNGKNRKKRGRKIGKNRKKNGKKNLKNRNENGRKDRKKRGKKDKIIGNMRESSSCKNISCLNNLGKGPFSSPLLCNGQFI